MAERDHVPGGDYAWRGDPRAIIRDVDARFLVVEYCDPIEWAELHGKRLIVARRDLMTSDTVSEPRVGGTVRVVLGPPKGRDGKFTGGDQLMRGNGGVVHHVVLETEGGLFNE